MDMESDYPPSYNDSTKGGGPPGPDGGFSHQQYPPPQGYPPPAQASYPPGQASYPPGQASYPPGQASYPPPQGGYPPQQGGYPPVPTNYPSAQQHPPQAVIVRGSGVVPPTNAILAWIACLCFCWPIGIVAVIKANQSSKCASRGDMAGARQHGEAAKKWAIAAIITAVLLGVAIGILYAIFIANNLVNFANTSSFADTTFDTNNGW